MNALVAQLRMDAKRIAADLATRPHPVADHNRLRERIIQIQSIGYAMRRAPRSVGPSQSRHGPDQDVLCPSCYLAGRPVAIMVAVPPSKQPPLFRCPSCGHEIVEAGPD
jgi:hypothetical protein